MEASNSVIKTDFLNFISGETTHVQSMLSKISQNSPRCGDLSPMRPPQLDDTLFHTSVNDFKLPDSPGGPILKWDNDTNP